MMDLIIKHNGQEEEKEKETGESESQTTTTDIHDSHISSMGISLESELSLMIAPETFTLLQMFHSNSANNKDPNNSHPSPPITRRRGGSLANPKLNYSIEGESDSNNKRRPSSVASFMLDENCHSGNDPIILFKKTIYLFDPGAIIGTTNRRFYLSRR